MTAEYVYGLFYSQLLCTIETANKTMSRTYAIRRDNIG